MPEMSKWPLILLIAMLITSCAEDETCRERTNVTLNSSFFQQGTTTALFVDSITVYGIGKDSLIYNNRKNAARIALPLNPNADISAFVLVSNSVHDTIRVIYSSQDFFISYYCGTVTTHKLDTVLTTRNQIRDIKIINHDINTTDVQHLQIFY